MQYELVGTWLIDGWGRELLASNTAGGIGLHSAGADGLLRWHPGEDGSIKPRPMRPVQLGMTKMRARITLPVTGRRIDETCLYLDRATDRGCYYRCSRRTHLGLQQRKSIS